MKIIEHIVDAVRGAAAYDPNAIDAPVCVLWPDKERQWEAVLPILLRTVDELLVLGDYDPDQRQGPGIWLRCAVAGTLANPPVPSDSIPILYIPGFSRQDLRAVETCPPELKPLAEYQYRGAIWSHPNGKDWTPYGFLVASAGGLSLDIAEDEGTRQSARAALPQLLFQSEEHLSGKHLDRDFFNQLITGGDLYADVLRWLDQPNEFRNERNTEQWDAFADLCSSQLSFDPRTDDATSALVSFAEHRGVWNGVWKRFCEAPQLYRAIPSRIRSCPMPDYDMFVDDEIRAGWPQWNDSEEEFLHRELLELRQIPPEHARAKLLKLEEQHARRRSFVWAHMGLSPFATVLEHLAVLAELTRVSLASGSITDMATAYQDRGYRADQAMLAAMAAAESVDTRSVVTAVAQALYVPWLDHSARHLQSLVNSEAYPGDTVDNIEKPDWTDGTCVLFVDGLRYDIAQRVKRKLSERDFGVTETVTWAALPSVTATGKPAVSPVRHEILGNDYTADFEPSVRETGKSLAGGYHFKKLLTQEGWGILDSTSVGNGSGKAWTEIGIIDHDGHQDAWKMAADLRQTISTILDRIFALTQAGWKSIHIVTDHGWLAVPGGLPKAQLTSGLSENKWGRCAAIKDGASTTVQRFPWFWNPVHSFALPTGTKSFIASREYAHGGLSLQECLTTHIVATPQHSSKNLTVSIEQVEWRKLRCNVTVSGSCDGMTVDIRRKPMDAASSVVTVAKEVKADGSASLVVENPDIEGEQASIVLLDTDGVMSLFVGTTIGG